MIKVKRYNSDSEIELLPRPFCGSDPEVVYIGNEYRESRVITIQCSNSNCRISRTDKTLKKNFSWLEDTAVCGWNMRVNREVMS